MFAAAHALHARIALTEVIRLGVLLVQRWLSILVHPMSLPM